MARYAVVESGTVTNVIEWDGSTAHSESDKFVLAAENAEIGATYNGSTFSYTPPAPPPDTRTYDQKRASEYPSVTDFMEAYTEKEIGGDSTRWDAYVIAYNKVRTDNPKP
jgi:hypothetical protein